MGVLNQRRFRANVHARLNHLTPWGTEILPLQIGAPQPWRLLYRPTRVTVVFGRAHCASPGLFPLTVTRFTDSWYLLSQAQTPGRLRPDPPRLHSRAVGRCRASASSPFRKVVHSNGSQYGSQVTASCPWG